MSTSPVAREESTEVVPVVGSTVTQSGSGEPSLNSPENCSALSVAESDSLTSTVSFFTSKSTILILPFKSISELARVIVQLSSANSLLSAMSDVGVFSVRKSSSPVSPLLSSLPAASLGLTFNTGTMSCSLSSVGFSSTGASMIFTSSTTIFSGIGMVGFSDTLIVIGVVTDRPPPSVAVTLTVKLPISPVLPVISPVLGSSRKPSGRPSAE